MRFTYYAYAYIQLFQWNSKLAFRYIAPRPLERVAFLAASDTLEMFS